MFFYTRKNTYPSPIKTRAARKLHRIRLPKNILFPSRSDIGIILKKVKWWRGAHTWKSQT